MLSDASQAIKQAATIRLFALESCFHLAYNLSTFQLSSYIHVFSITES